MVKFTGKVMSQESGQQFSEDDAPYRIKSRDFTVTSGEHTCIQSKPNMTGTGSAGITPFESSPRFAAGVAGGKIVGYMSNPILKTTALLPGGNCGPMRCVEGKLETGVHSTRTVSVMCVLEAMSDVRGTVSQGPTVILVNKGDYKAWESVMEFEGAEAGCWNASPGTEIDNNSAGSVVMSGYIKVILANTTKYIALFDAGSLAD